MFHFALRAASRTLLDLPTWVRTKTELPRASPLHSPSPSPSDICICRHCMLFERNRQAHASFAVPVACAACMESMSQRQPRPLSHVPSCHPHCATITCFHVWKLPPRSTHHTAWMTMFGMLRSRGTGLSTRVCEAPGVSGGALLLGPPVNPISGLICPRVRPRVLQPCGTTLHHSRRTDSGTLKTSRVCITVAQRDLYFIVHRRRPAGFGLICLIRVRASKSLQLRRARCVVRFGSIGTSGTRF